MSRSRRVRLPGKAGKYRTAAVGSADLAPSITVMSPPPEDMKQPVNILLVDDQPSKLLSYETILEDLGENLIKVTSGREALEYLLKNEIAVVLVDVCMPDLDGYELTAMIRDHPRFQKTAIILVSGVMTE